MFAVSNWYSCRFLNVRSFSKFSVKVRKWYCWLPDSTIRILLRYYQVAKSAIFGFWHRILRKKRTFRKQPIYPSLTANIPFQQMKTIVWYLFVFSRIFVEFRKYTGNFIFFKARKHFVFRWKHLVYPSEKKNCKKTIFSS